MPKTEKKLQQSIVYRGNFLTVEKVEILFASGLRTEREIIHHPGAVSILALNEEGDVLLVRQFRSAIDEELWEIPAGKLEKEESPLKSAQRELLEETGHEAKNWVHLHSFYPSPGYSDEIIHLFLAQELRQKKHKAQPDEEIEWKFFPRQELDNFLKPGQVRDGKTLLALHYLKLHV